MNAAIRYATERWVWGDAISAITAMKIIYSNS